MINKTNERHARKCACAKDDDDDDDDDDSLTV